MPNQSILKRLLLLTTLAIVVVAGYAAWHVWGISSAPEGQPPLVEISQQNYAGFRDAFNAAAGEPRIIALLSPT